MSPTPKHLPILTMGLLFGGMAVFILGSLFPLPTLRLFVKVGTAIFFAGLLAALVGAIWSICTLANSAQRRTYGIATPIATILIATVAWSGALLTIYKFKQSNDVRLEAELNRLAALVQALKPRVDRRQPPVAPAVRENLPPPRTNDGRL